MITYFPLELVVGSQFLAIILSTGAAAMIAAIIQAYRSIKDGAKSDEKDAFADISASRKAESVKRRNAQTMEDYWHNRAGELEFVITSNLGADKLPAAKTLPKLETEE